MKDFLTSVLARKEEELVRRRNGRPAIDRGPSRDLADALRGGGAVIAEIKRRSPTVAAFRNGGDPPALARIYREAGAAAISIVTDTAAFGMTLDDVAPVREASGLPVLVKDFITDARQIDDAHAAGADAVLLIARIVDGDALRRLYDHARGLGLAVLLECHDEKDVESAAAVGARVVGINNRNLATLVVDIETTPRLLTRLPAGAVAVCESGIGDAHIISTLSARGVHAFLVGGALLSADDPGSVLREMIGAAAGAFETHRKEER